MSWQFSLAVSFLRLRVTPTMLAQSAYFHLLNNNRLFPSLTPNITAILFHSLIASCINHCSSILFALPFKCLHKTSAGPELCSPYHYQISVHRSNNSSSLEASLAPTDFKILLLTFKALHHPPPLYLSELIQIYTPSHTLRASSATQLTTVSPHLTTMWSSELSPTRHSFTALTFSTLKSWISWRRGFTRGRRT